MALPFRERNPKCHTQINEIEVAVVLVAVLRLGLRKNFPGQVLVGRIMPIPLLSNYHT